MQPIGRKQLWIVSDPVAQTGAEPEIPIHKIVVTRVQWSNIFNHAAANECGRLGNRVLALQNELAIIKPGTVLRTFDRLSIRPGEQRIAKNDIYFGMLLQVTDGLRNC